MERGPCKHGQSLLAKIPREISDAGGKQESLSVPHINSHLLDAGPSMSA